MFRNYSSNEKLTDKNCRYCGVRFHRNIWEFILQHSDKSKLVKSFIQGDGFYTIKIYIGEKNHVSQI